MPYLTTIPTGHTPAVSPGEGNIDHGYKGLYELTEGTRQWSNGPAVLQYLSADDMSLWFPDHGAKLARDGPEFTAQWVLQMYDGVDTSVVFSTVDSRVPPGMNEPAADQTQHVPDWWLYRTEQRVPIPGAVPIRVEVDFECSDTKHPTKPPTLSPSTDPTLVPSEEPSLQPTFLPSVEPTLAPSEYRSFWVLNVFSFRNGLPRFPQPRSVSTWRSQRTTTQ